MLEYEISQALHYGSPVLGGIICLIIGVLITNRGWKNRIFRYAKAEVIQIMEYQENKIKQYEKNLKNAKDKIGTLEGIIKLNKKNALKIIGNIELKKGE